MGTTTTKVATMGSVWMELRDHTLLAELLETKKMSRRTLAKAAGWKSHTYMNKLLRGEVKTLKTDPAIRIALALEVPFGLLFVAHADETSDQPVRKKPAA